MDVGERSTYMALNDLFLAVKDIEGTRNFADDTTPLVCDPDLNINLIKLEENSAVALTWFETSYMKLNSDKIIYLF